MDTVLNLSRLMNTRKNEVGRLHINMIIPPLMVSLKFLCICFYTIFIPKILIGITYLITGLNHGTKYLIRAASRNPAGLSEYTETKEFSTLSLKPPVSSDATKFISSLVITTQLTSISIYYFLRVFRS